MADAEFRSRPCAACPWRLDADLARFSRDDMVKLARADEGQERVGAPAMACHIDQPGTAHALRLCAGWLAVAGPGHLGVRMQLIAGQLPVDAVQPDGDWPELYSSLDELLAAYLMTNRKD